MILDIIPNTGDLQTVGIIILLLDKLFTWLTKSKPDTLIKIYTEYRLKKNSLSSKLDKETLSNLELETKVLKETNSYLLKEINKHERLTKTIDILRDKYNFQRVFTLMFSNGTVTLSGSGMFYYSVQEECYSYKENSIKHLYQRKSLTPLYSLISICLEKAVWDSEKEKDIDEVNRLLSLHRSNRMLATAIVLDNNIIGLLVTCFGDYTTYPHTSDSKSTIVDELIQLNAESDILLTKHHIEAVHLKYS